MTSHIAHPMTCALVEPTDAAAEGDDDRLQALLSLLARRGNGIRLDAGADGRPVAIAVEIATGTGAESVAATVGEIEAALAAGLLEPAPGSSVLRLSGPGRARLKRMKLAATLARAGAAGPPPPGPWRTAEEPSSTRRRVAPEAGAPGQNDAESPLAWLHRRRDKDGRAIIDEHQFAAGERLRADLWFARLTPRVTAPWSGVPEERRARGAPGTGMEMADRLVAARQRVAGALEAVGPELSGILVDVCGHLKGLEEIERSEGWPQRSAKLLLQKALTALARHYGLLPPEAARDIVRRRLRHWGADDYRPTLDSWQQA